MIITSISSSSQARYPFNTNTEFTQHLPDSFIFDHNKSYLIGVKSIIIAFNLSPWTTRKGYFKVYLKEITPSTNISTDEDLQYCLCRVPAPENQFFTYDETIENNIVDASVYKFEFKNPTYFSPSSDLSTLTSLSWIITDEDNKKLELQDGPPTVILLDIQEMDEADQFLFSVNPAISLAEYTSNENSRFTVTFPSEISLDDQWEMALHSVITPRWLMVSPLNKRSMDFVVVHSDIIKNSMFGSSQQPFLHLLTTKEMGLHQTSGDSVFIVSNLTFHKLAHERFNHMKFELKSIDGDYLNITSSHTSDNIQSHFLQFILMFRKIKK